MNAAALIGVVALNAGTFAGSVAAVVAGIVLLAPVAAQAFRALAD